MKYRGCAKIRGAKIKGAKIKGARKFKGIRQSSENKTLNVLENALLVSLAVQFLYVIIHFLPSELFTPPVYFTTPVNYFSGGFPNPPFIPLILDPRVEGCQNDFVVGGRKSTTNPFHLSHRLFVEKLIPLRIIVQNFDSILNRFDIEVPQHNMLIFCCSISEDRQHIKNMSKMFTGPYRNSCEFRIEILS